MPKKTPRAPMGHVRAGEPWDVLAFDFLGPLPVTARGNRFIIVATDEFTKHIEVWAIPNQTAEECALHVVNDAVARWGMPAAIQTRDVRSKLTCSRNYAHYCILGNVEQVRATLNAIDR